eukprot:CAMPEP_0198712046 /NCGR_PEP_ID=MMETSP1471-20131121/3972_1 /TAXON_ID=41880 /ORGANISM="Pycnococcus provasolii, Strain RCC733" /LENGTH=36 /DNA_ID= /DNA_START= /DNA_END= /DNA_ORIENTATION=
MSSMGGGGDVGGFGEGACEEEPPEGAAADGAECGTE